MMSLSRARTKLACFVTTLIAAGCSSSPSEVPSGTSEAPIINGSPGGPAQVGRLLWSTPNQSRWWICSGALVAPDLVLSARHCIYDGNHGDIPFAEEPDGAWSFELYDTITRKFTDKTAISETMAPPIVASTNFAEWEPPYGTPDVALFRLATPITRLTPLPISREPVGFENPLFSTSGFGFTAHKPSQQSDSLSNGLSSTELELRALEGQYFHSTYPTFGDFLAAVGEATGSDPSSYSPADLQLLQSWYDGPLAQGFEGYFSADVDSQPCHGDSGGPLLQQGAAGTLAIHGVISGGLDLSGAARCEFGEIYALFNEPVQKFLEQHGLFDATVGGSSATGGSAGTSTGGTNAGGTSLGGVSAGGTSTGDAGSSDDGPGVAGSGGMGRGGSGGSGNGGVYATAGGPGVAGFAPSAGSAGRGSGIDGDTRDPESSPDSDGCSIAARTPTSQMLSVFAAVVGLLAARRRRGSARGRDR